MPFGDPIVGGLGTLIRFAIRSPNYVAGVSGWAIKRDGTAELNGVTVRGQIIVGTPGAARIEIGPGDVINLFSAANVLVGTLQPGSLVLQPGQQLTAYELDNTSTKPNVIIGNGFGVIVSPNFNGATASFISLGYIPGGESSLTIQPDQGRTSWNAMFVESEQEPGGTSNLDQVALILATGSPGPAVTAYDTAIRVVSQSHDTTIKSRVDIGAWSVRMLDSWTGGQNVFLAISHAARTAATKHAWALTESGTAIAALSVQVDGDLTTRLEIRADGLIRIKESLANSSLGRAVLVAGAVTVNTPIVDATSEIFVTCQIPGGAPGALRVDSRVNGVSFTIKSTSATDTSTVAWHIVEGY